VPEPSPEPARPPEIELPTNRWLIHRLSAALLPHAIGARVPANAASLLGLAFGLLAAAAFLDWRDPGFVLLGWLLLIFWLVMDGLDGAIARATGTASPMGRFLDGFADYGVFVVVHVALVVSLDASPATLALALAAGAAHALQSAFYEAARATYRRRIAGVFAVPPREAAGGLVERVYNAIEARAGHRATAFDEGLAALPAAERGRAVARWAEAAAARLRLLGLLSSNARVHAIALACLLGNPALAWWWELGALSLLVLAMAWSWRALESGDTALACNFRRAR
jgi:phosphatidylglycerophosphate synthase